MPDRKPRSAQNHNPHQLPTKLCPSCGLPFTWRKKWARDWPQVVYCSDRCRQQGTPQAPLP